MAQSLYKTFTLSLLVALSFAGCSKTSSNTDNRAARESPTGARTADGSLKFSGNKVSFHLTDIEVSDLLNRLASAGGINVLISPRVTGKMSVRWKNIPWDQAMRAVLHANRLDIVSGDGNLYLIDTMETGAVERAKELQH